jgi:hypothetical protein
MNPHLSRHDSLITSMIDATPPCPIEAGEQRWKEYRSYQLKNLVAVFGGRPLMH